MSQDIARILSELRQDHKNMARLLNVLERESNSIYDGGDPDTDLMQDIMLYMTTYPDVVHHPKEDRIYADLKNSRPELSGGFERIGLEHRGIAEQGLKLRDQLVLIDAGAMLRRSAVVADALRYVNGLRSHMQWEELDLFRRVEQLIRDGHALLDEVAYPARPDPLFGTRVEQRFQKLFKSIELQL